MHTTEAFYFRIETLALPRIRDSLVNYSLGGRSLPCFGEIVSSRARVFRVTFLHQSSYLQELTVKLS